MTAIIGAYQESAELVARIKKTSRGCQNEQAFQEKQLQESLQNGGRIIKDRYIADCRALGLYVKKGDCALCYSFHGVQC